MAKTDDQLHYECMNRFIALANEMGKEGISKRVVSAGLMTASCVFATYEAIGNNGRLNQAGINSISLGYRKQLERIQDQREKRDEKMEEKEIEETVERMVSFPEDD